MKICCKCKQEKDYTHYAKSKSRKDGYNPQCKECGRDWRENNKELLREKKKEYYKQNKDTIREVHKDRYARNKNQYLTQIRDFYTENRGQYLLNKSKERAKLSGLEHNIELSDITIPTHCPILGIELTTDLGKGQLQTNASIDRIDSTKGYTKGNIQIISRLANTMKSNATKEQLIKFGEWCQSLRD